MPKTGNGPLAAGRCAADRGLMSIAPAPDLTARAASRLVVLVLVLAAVTAALVAIGWAVTEALSPAAVEVYAPGPLPLSSTGPGGAI